MFKHQFDNKVLIFGVLKQKHSKNLEYGNNLGSRSRTL